MENVYEAAINKYGLPPIFGNKNGNIVKCMMNTSYEIPPT